MIPAAFDYRPVRSVEEAIALLQQHGDEAKILAGGQSLIPTMKFRLAQPGVLVDLGRMPGLSYIREENGAVAIGAMTTYTALERSDLLLQRALGDVVCKREQGIFDPHGLTRFRLPMRIQLTGGRGADEYRGESHDPALCAQRRDAHSHVVLDLLCVEGVKLVRPILVIGRAAQCIRAAARHHRNLVAEAVARSVAERLSQPVTSERVACRRVDVEP